MRHLLTVCLLALALAGCQSPAAQEREDDVVRSPRAQDEAPVAACPQSSSELIDVDVQRVPLERVLDQIARQVGWNIILAPDVEEEVTLSLRDLPWRRALEIILDRNQCEARLMGDNLLYVTQEPRVTLQLCD